MSMVNSPCFAWIQKGWKHIGLLDLQLYAHADTTCVPDIVVESSKYDTGLEILEFTSSSMLPFWDRNH
jgi:hypothetical protein